LFSFVLGCDGSLQFPEKSGAFAPSLWSHDTLNLVRPPGGGMLKAICSST